ncbi:cobyrinate a,c-diamide synthase [Solimicrobium silvestre]|uniref:CobB: cobyrinic acid a,c-diamide synthase n=1 Tax=Solimicrobium silvestre TaxID=2099400 RepID=A0A2S9GUZ9_9BURK|nr:cobyrinate a,c-diamide synthase [Solimicrobium silvestre]PRC91528.1 cobB: cobyrinic acid a,c-diamide synthase [Solimicrobium silvestre]
MQEQLQARILLVSAVASGQGKTTVTAALARKLVLQGLRVRVFKTGPDFLDPMLLEIASRAPVYSLDLWMVGLEQCRTQLAEAARVADVILIEGVMGLYDGAPSSADLARAFGVPVLAVVDVSAMAQTCGAVVTGLRDYGPVNLAGVIANRVASPGHAAMVVAALRDIPMLASLSRQEKSLPERHLGLVLPDEVADIESLLDTLAEQLTLDADVWNAISPVQLDQEQAIEQVTSTLAGTTIAIARDAAFAFLYPANLDCLTKLGAKLCFFSPLANQPVPSGANAIYLPGGYPELHAATLSKAMIWQDSIRQAHARDVSIWAECGGMMSLTDSLSDLEGNSWSMAGILPGHVAMQKRLAGLGSQGLTTRHGILRGHTFHYSRLETSVAPISATFKHSSAGTGAVGEAVYKVGSLTASYFHAYFPSCPLAAAMLLTGEMVI